MAGNKTNESKLKPNPITNSFTEFKAIANSNGCSVDRVSYYAGALMAYQMMIDISEQPEAIGFPNMDILHAESLRLGNIVDKKLIFPKGQTAD